MDRVRGDLKLLLEEQIEQKFKDADEYRRSDTEDFYRSLLEDAFEKMDSRALDANGHEARSLLWQAEDISGRVYYALGGVRKTFAFGMRGKEGWPLHANWRIDTKQKTLTQHSEGGSLHFLCRVDALENAVGSYLSSDLRSRFADEALVKVYLDTLLVRYIGPLMRNFRGTSATVFQFMRHPVWYRFKTFLYWQISPVVLFLLILWIAGGVYAVNQGDIRSMQAGLATMFPYVLGLYLAQMIAVVLFMTLELKALLSWSRETRKALTEIDKFHTLFKTSGPISTSHLRERLSVLDDRGVEMSAGLYALLSDMEARGHFTT